MFKLKESKLKSRIEQLEIIVGVDNTDIELNSSTIGNNEEKLNRSISESTVSVSNLPPVDSIEENYFIQAENALKQLIYSI